MNGIQICEPRPFMSDSVGQGRIYARAKGARAQGGILKKIEIEVWYAGKKRLSTREKFNP
jgi:hypothetical protein